MAKKKKLGRPAKPKPKSKTTYVKEKREIYKCGLGNPDPDCPRHVIIPGDDPRFPIVRRTSGPLTFWCFLLLISLFLWGMHVGRNLSNNEEVE